MIVIRANKSHRDHVLRLLDDFRTACMGIISSENGSISTTARELGGGLFEKVVFSSDSAIFLAVDKNKYVGIATVHKIPQIRKGTFCGEIEEMFVESEYQGKGAAQLLIDSIEKWAKKEGISAIRLESSNKLNRAHSFYKKAGFEPYGQAFKKNI